MKKINWLDVAMFVLVAVLTCVGVYFVENEWIYELETAVIWISGMFCMTIVYVTCKFIKIVKEVLKEIVENND